MNPPGLTFADAKGVATIVNDDLLDLTIDGPAQFLPEGGPGETGNAVFRVALKSRPGSDVSVRFATIDAAATAADNDYEPTSGLLRFTPTGALEQRVSVVVNGDSKVELEEAFAVQLSDPINAQLGTNIAGLTPGRGVAVIDNDDSTELDVLDTTVVEGDVGLKNAVVTARLTNPASYPITFQYATADGTARSPGDYISTNGSAVVPPGALSVSLPVPVVGDTVDEGDETFLVRSQSVAGPDIERQRRASGATLGQSSPVANIGDPKRDVRQGRPQATVTILNDDEGRLITVTFGDPNRIPPVPNIPATATTTTAPSTATGSSVPGVTTTTRPPASPASTTTSRVSTTVVSTTSRPTTTRVTTTSVTTTTIGTNVGGVVIGTASTTTSTTILPSAASLILNPRAGRTGDLATVTGKGFKPGEKVLLRWSPGLGGTVVTAGTDGGFRVPVLVFPNDRTGPRKLMVSGRDTVAAPYLVDGASRPGGSNRKIVFPR